MLRRLRVLLEKAQNRRKARKLKKQLLDNRKRKQKREQLELPFDHS